MNLSQLTPDATPCEAEQWLGDLVFSIGLGFHPDTPGIGYVHAASGQELLSPAAATRLDDDLDRAFSLLGESVYDHGFRFQWRLLHALPKIPVDDERSRLIQELAAIDRNGEFTDEDAFRNGWAPMTIEQVRAAFARLTSESDG